MVKEQEELKKFWDITKAGYLIDGALKHNFIWYAFYDKTMGYKPNSGIHNFAAFTKNFVRSYIYSKQDLKTICGWYFHPGRRAQNLWFMLSATG